MTERFIMVRLIFLGEEKTENGCFLAEVVRGQIVVEIVMLSRLCQTRECTCSHFCVAVQKKAKHV